MKLEHIDNEREFDWGKTSRDYAAYRPGYPESFYNTIAELGIGMPGQKILDLGTGTGVLARAFAKRGASVTGVDIAENQITIAKELAAGEELDISFGVSPAEEIDFPDGSFDVISAGQSWLYFDKSVLIPKVHRLLSNGGCLLLTHFFWLPLKDRIARETEELVLKYNPNWNAAGYKGDLPEVFEWSKDSFKLRTFRALEAEIGFTRESWRGRIRACRGVGASLPTNEAEKFDDDLGRLLEVIVPEEFSVLHQMTIHILEPNRPK